MMESEYAALSTAYRDLFPVMHLVSELSDSIGIKSSKGANIYV